MKNEYSLFMVMMGCTPEGRHTEQHDIFFGIGKTLKDLIPEMDAFWPEAKGRFHIDAWRKVTRVDDYSIKIKMKNNAETIKHLNTENLFFINLGGYKENEFEEYHYKVLAVGKNIAEASKTAKKTAFFKHVTFKGATSHIDDKYGIDLDDIYNVKDLLKKHITEKYLIHIEKCDSNTPNDLLHIGYLKKDKIQ